MAKHKVPGEHTYKGMVMNGMFLPNVLDRIPDFQFYPEDVLIQTYPKAGNLIFTSDLHESYTALAFIQFIKYHCYLLFILLCLKFYPCNLTWKTVFHQ